MPNLGPLTTTYTATSSIACQSIHLATDTEGFWLERGIKFEDCFPTNFTPLDGYYYSPGICQDGYSYACTAAVGGSGTTAATCCPSGFTCRSTRSADDNDACQSILRLDSSYIGDVIAYPDGTSTVIGTTRTLISAGETIYAIGVPVRRAATDAKWSILPSTNTDSTATQMETSAISTESMPESSRSVRPTRNTSRSGSSEHSQPSSSSGGTGGHITGDSAVHTGLSAAAMAAIGVGTTLGVLFFLAAIAAIYHIRKRKGRAPAPPPSSQEAADTEGKSSRPRSEHESEEQRGVYEMNAYREPGELTAHWEPAELD
ncbi:hypothetical protein F5B21DRAFT_492398 [Xylaria acuta]|nr:hypothetical protein F5B21DRAFT_492398 [Xylaria acuta]